VIQVLEMGGGFSGINRKVQLKPISWGTKKLRIGPKYFKETKSSDGEKVCFFFYFLRDTLYNLISFRLPIRPLVMICAVLVLF
jgi:hypothetical protein